MGRRTANRLQRMRAKRDRVKQQSTTANTASNPMVELQQSIGSQAVQRLINSPYIQTKLQVSSPSDESEREADQTSESVMRTSNSAHDSAAASTHASHPGVHSRVEQVLSAQHSSSPLPADVRGFMEPRLDADLSDVRIHTDHDAAQLNKQLQSKAFTHGRDIYFAAGRSPQNDSLTAHELVHVIQQTSQGSSGKIHCRRLAGDETPLEVSQKKDEPLVGTLIQRSPDNETFEEAAGKISERPEERAWSKSSAGLTEEETPGEKFLLMNFAIEEASLKKEHEDFLSQTVYFGHLTTDPMAKIVIVGHADSTGEPSVNEALAKKRAKAVESALKQLGRHNTRIETVKGKGARDPVSDNKTVLGRARNRRVEIFVTPFSPTKPMPELLTDLQKGVKPFVFKVDNFAACPFGDTVKKIVEDGFTSVPTIKFDWTGNAPSPDGFITIDATTSFPTALGLSGDIFLRSFRENEICKTPTDASTCEKVFPETASVMGRAIANAIAHEAGHAFALDHVPGTDNFMWSPELHPLNGKPNKTFDDKVLLKRTLQSVPETFNSSQLVHMLHRIKEKRKTKAGVVEFE